MTSTHVPSPKQYAFVLGALAFAFLLRVVGQMLVAFVGVEFLPPMSAWYSGLLPYPLLLPSQFLILLVQGWIVRDLWRGTGYFSRAHPSAGRILCWLSYVYAGGMVVRYIVTMSLHPERRWLTGTIPICFHFVLAAFLFVLGRFQIQAGPRVSDDDRA
jgi:hypothetical protein